MLKFLTSFFLSLLFLPFFAHAEEGDFSYLSFQRGTNILEKNDTTKTEYLCDEEQEVCKINLLFIDKNEEALKDSQYDCQTIFSFETDEENKCNPSYIEIPAGRQTLGYSIIKKSDNREIISREIVFVNKKEDRQEDEAEEAVDENENSEEPETSYEETTEESTETDETTEEENSDEESEDTQEENPSIAVPEITLQIQSGAEFDTEEDTKILCPEQGEDVCKINFSLGEIDEQLFTCVFDFGLGELSGQEHRCNPSYVDFPEGAFELCVRIFEKNNEKNVSEKIFTVDNQKIIEDENVSHDGENNETDNNTENSDLEESVDNHPDIHLQIQSGAEFSTEDEQIILCPEAGSGVCKINFLVEADECLWDFGLETKTGYEQKCNPSYIDFPVGETTVSLQIGAIQKTFTVQNTAQDVDFELELTTQTPNYLLETDTENYFACDSSKKVCKVNFDLRESFGEMSPKHFSCHHRFSFGETGEEKKCNPNTIEIPLGEHQLTFQMTSGLTTKTKTITVKNTGYIAKTKKKTAKITEKIAIPNSEIIVQSGLTDGMCEKKLCKLNFKYDTEKVKGLSCVWDFGKTAIYDEKTAKKCNPGYVQFPPGKHRVSVTVFQKNKKSNAFETSLSFENSYMKPELQARIELQGKHAKYKKFFVNRVICNGVEECSLNFDGSASSGEIASYSWDLGDGEVFDGKNPKSKKFRNNTTVTLTVTDEEGKTEIAEFFIEVHPEKLEKTEILELLFADFTPLWHLHKDIVSLKNNFDFFKQKALFEAQKEKREAEQKIALRKNKNYATLYGTTAPNATIIIEKRVDFLFIDGLFVRDVTALESDEEGKFKQKILYDELGNFRLVTYEDDELLGELFFPKKELEVTQELQEGVSEKSKKESIFEPVEIALKLQGKIGKNKIINGDTITCLGTCSINFTSNSTGSIKSEHWDFGNGESSTKKNPKSVKYKHYGNYEIVYTVTDENGAVFIKNYHIIFTKAPKKSKKKKGKKGPVELFIEVQGKIGKNKKLEVGKLTCFETCKVNFDGRASKGAYKELIWDFENGETYVGENPKYIEYEKTGNYRVTLKAEGYDGKWYEKSFLVQYQKEKKTSEIVSAKNADTDIFLETMLVEKRVLKKLDIFYLSLIVCVIIFGGSFVYRDEIFSR